MACAFSWGGAALARGWSGASAGDGPAARVGGALARADVALVAGSRHSLAVDKDGAVFSWGANNSNGGGDAYFVHGGSSSAIPDSGQLGRHPLPGARASRHAPAPVRMSRAVAVGAGRYHSLAVDERSRRVYSWGLNDHGQLGRAGSEGREPSVRCVRGARCRDGWPRRVGGEGVALPPVADVAAGRYFSVAVGASGRAYAWGRCSCGHANRSAYPSFVRSSPSPYALEGEGLEAEHVVKAAAGYAHLLLLTRRGLLFSCESGDDGYGGRLQVVQPLNGFGQLGRPGPPLVHLTLPRRMVAPFSASPLVAIAAGRCASFALNAAGEVLSWGCGAASGQSSDRTLTPKRFDGLAQRVTLIAAGEYHAVVATGQGEVLVWGAGAGSAVPVRVRGLPRRQVLSVAAGYQHSLAVIACDTAD
ncbi:hypothetical protein AB1Y20_003254 [Prymnesium parvum]|uniref:RCC1-like domain-containing protein n=1 Tax=Prymnesium parvum TaxID=97485 RepID=A0AB34JAB6_PRYPA